VSTRWRFPFSLLVRRLPPHAPTQRWSLEYADGKIALQKIRRSDIVEVLYRIEHSTGEKKGSMGLDVPLRERQIKKKICR
jgi:hypothetical protein